MRRALLVPAIGIPLVVLAAITAPAGSVIDTTNYNTLNAVNVSYVNAAACAGSDKLHLQWNITALSGQVFAQSDQYKLFASNKVPTTDATGAKFCADQTDSANGVFAGPIGSMPASVPLQSLDVSGVDAAKATSPTNVTCSATNEGTAIYICAHWTDAGTTKKGFATGTFLVQVNAPPDPTGLSPPEPGSSSVKLSWAANPPTPTATDHYIVWVFPQGQAPTPGTKPDTFPPAVSTATTNGTSATITGLQNGVTYDIVVVAYSIGGNASGASQAVQGQPVPTAGFWDVYKDRGGVEQGGCASGSGGALALLGVASLVALRRRKP